MKKMLFLLTLISGFIAKNIHSDVGYKYYFITSNDQQANQSVKKLIRDSADISRTIEYNGDMSFLIEFKSVTSSAAIANMFPQEAQIYGFQNFQEEFNRELALQRTV